MYPTVQPPVIIVNPIPALVNLDANHTLSVEANGTGLSYQWKRNEIDIAGANNATYTISGFSLQHEGTYKCVVSNSEANATSQAAPTFLKPPNVSAEPFSDAFNERNSTSWGTQEVFKNAGRLKFKNTKLFLETNGPATGKDQAFQKYNGSRLPANHDWTAQMEVNLPDLNWTNTEQLFLAIEVFNADDIGDFLVHELKNDHNKNRELHRSLNVNGAEILDTETNTALTHTTLRLRWAASEKRLYAEYDPDGPANGDNWSILQNYDLANGATNWNLNPTTGSFMILLYAGSENRTVTTANNLWFDNFKITDGNQTAPPVAPTITTHPIDRNATVGSNVSFTVEANGTDPLAYQWQKNGVNVNGATAATLTLSNVQLADDNSSYRAVVSNIAGSATSNPATLKVLDNNGTPPPIINSQPTHVTTSFDGNATFTVEANGTGIKYQWRVNGVMEPNKLNLGN